MIPQRIVAEISRSWKLLADIEEQKHYARLAGSVVTWDIDLNGPSITCKICGSTSFNRNDVEQHYCGRCHVFHDDLWPPLRPELIGHPERLSQIS